MSTDPPPPAARILACHLAGARFRAGEDAGRWGLLNGGARETLPHWPKVSFWVQAAPRERGPDRFHFVFDFTNYPAVAPTGHLSDPKDGSVLPEASRPKGRDRMYIFRMDWKDGAALYHPYDRVGADSHPDWPGKYPHLIWTPRHSVCDLLVELHNLLTSEEYTHV